MEYITEDLSSQIISRMIFWQQTQKTEKITLERIIPFSRIASLFFIQRVVSFSVTVLVALNNGLSRLKSRCVNWCHFLYVLREIDL